MPAIFGFGTTGGTGGGNVNNITNLVDNTGTVAANNSGVGTARRGLAAAGYGGDKAIFGYGWHRAGVSPYTMTNLVDNTGVVATDTTGVGTARYALAAATYGGDKAIFGFGFTSATNLVSSAGVVATDTATVGTARYGLAAAGYGGDKAIFGFGYAGEKAALWVARTNLVDNTGVVATDVIYTAATARSALAAAGYGTDKAIFGFGYKFYNYVSTTNLVDNTGVVATDTTTVATAKGGLAAAGFNNDQAIFGFGVDNGGTQLSVTNIISNTGIVAADTASVGTARYELAAASYGTLPPDPPTPTTTTAAPTTTTAAPTTTTAAPVTTTTAAPTTTTAAPTTTTAAPTTTTAAPIRLITLTNTGKVPVTIQSMNFTDPPGVVHTVDLSNLGGGSAVSANQIPLAYKLRVGTPATFTVDYQSVSAPIGTYAGKIVINGKFKTSQTINSTVVVNPRPTTTTTLAPPTTTTEAPPPPNTRVEPCNTDVRYNGGITFPSRFIIDFGPNTAGTVTFTYEAYSVPDRFVVIHNGIIQVDTDYVGNPYGADSVNAALPNYSASTTTDGVTITHSPVSSIGPNNFSTGVSFTKVPSSRYATILIFAPIPGTAWVCKLTCAAPL